MKKRTLTLFALSLCLCFSTPLSASESEAAIEMSEADTVQEAAISDDLYSFEMLIDGELYRFPMTYQEFISRGWTYDGEESAEISPNQYTGAEVFKKDDLTVYTSIVNLGLNVKPISECAVAGITVEDFYLKDTDVDIRMPGGISFKDSTLDDILAAYGEPTRKYEGDTLTSLTYTYDYYQEIDFSLSTETRKISEIQIQNMVETDDIAVQDEISTEVPDIVYQYQAPEALGSDIKACVVELEGAFYQIPAPISAFLENGWTLRAESSAEFIAAHQTDWVTLMKNNQTLKVLAENYSDQAVTIENCFLLSVKSDVYNSKFALTLPGGITIGMSKEDLLDAFGDTEYEEQDSGSFTYYTVTNYHSTYDGVDISVNNENGTISSIEVSHQPSLDELFR